MSSLLVTTFKRGTEKPQKPIKTKTLKLKVERVRKMREKIPQKQTKKLISLIVSKRPHFLSSVITL